MKKSTQQCMALLVVNIFLYIFFISEYIKDETAPISKVVPLYILTFTLTIIIYVFVKNIQNGKVQILATLIVLCIQLGLGVFLTTLWFAPRSDYILAHQIWLTHLSILAGLNYVGGMSILFECIFKTL